MNPPFLPILYWAWSDEWMSPTEFAILDDFFRSHPQIDTAQREAILKAIDPKNPPGRDELRSWRKQIEAALDSNPQPTDLFGLTARLSDNGFNLSREAYLELERRLGINSAELVSEFRHSRESRTLKAASSGTAATPLSGWFAGSGDGVSAALLQTLQRPEFDRFTGETKSEYREKVLDWCRSLANEGFGSIAYPTESGGKADMAGYFAAMETLSFHDLSLVIKFGVQFGLWGMSVYFLGTEKHHSKYLKAIGDLELPGCFAMTETGHGSNVNGLETSATYDHATKSLIIHSPTPQSQKEYIGNAAVHGQMATVFAKLIIDGKDYGVNAFIVSIRDASGNVEPGVTIGDCGKKMGLNGVDNGTIRFNNVRIPLENMLDRFAQIDSDGQFQSPIPSDDRRFFTMLGTLVGGRIGIPRSALSALKSGLAIALRYSDTRKQFGPEDGPEVPILNYRVHQKRLLPHLASAYAFHAGLQYLTDRFLNRTEADSREVETLAAGMKAYVTWAIRDALQECREAMGGKGYLSENRIDDLKNDMEIYTTFEGDNTVLLQLVAKNRLTEFRRQYGKLDLGGMISYVYDSAVTAVSEKNPIVTRRTDDDHLKDPEFHKNAFRYRENQMLKSAALRLKRLIDEGMDAYDAFNVVQPQLIDTAKAHVERVILEAFIDRIQAQTPEIRGQLFPLEQLFALSVLERHKAWFLENGYFEAAKSKAVRKLLYQSCWDLRPQTLAYVAAFGIPEKLLGAAVLKD